MKLKICLLGLLCLFFQAQSQTSVAPRPLSVGDKLPDIRLTGIINSGFKSANISDYKGKVVILDFWNTFCSSCVAGFPDWDSFQRQYPKDLQVFLVDKYNKYETPKAVQTAINLTSETIHRKFKLPIVYDDTTAVKYFIFNSVPHVVWIDRHGIIAAITGKQEVTPENIAKLIHGEHLNLAVKTAKNTN